MKRTCAYLVVIFSINSLASAESVSIATYNIENFHLRFLSHRVGKADPPLPEHPAIKEMLDVVRKANDEDNWEIAQVILCQNFNPDILVIQEGCRQEDLEFFNKRWLNEAYQTIITFPSNTGRDQHLNLLMKPGFKLIEQRDQYHVEPDSVPNPRDERLFARGPAFALVETPGGSRMWVGTTHQKSKSGNSLEVTQWRNREAIRTNQIMQELHNTDPHPVILLGDINDELGIQEFEMEGGGDTVANLVGDDGAFYLATRPLVDAGKISFGGYSNPRFRSFIDHIVISSTLKDQVLDVRVIDESPAHLASDHYPVMIKLQTQ